MQSVTDPSARSAVSAALALDEAQRCLGTNDHAAGIQAAQHAWQAAQASGDAPLAARAAALWMTHLHRRGDVEQAVTQGQRALAALPDELDPASRAELLGAMALSTDQLDLLGEALEHALAALDCARRSEQPALVCLALSRVARTYTRLNNPARGGQFAQEALLLARRIGDVDQIFRALNTLTDAQTEEGDLLLAGGRPDEARRCHEAAVATSEAALQAVAGEDNAYRTSVGLVNRAHALNKLGRAAEALQTLDRMLDQTQRHGFQAVARAQIEMRATALIALGRLAEARQLTEQALADPETAADASLAPQLHERLYQACKAQGDLAAALHHHEQLMRLEQRRFRQRNDAKLRVLLARTELERSRADAEQATREAQAERERAAQLQAERDQLQQQAHELGRDAHLDVLTGLANRRALERRLHELLRREPPAPSSCLAIVDIDHFKNVNDRHGHVAGDAVLQALGALLAQGFREPDYVARYGGEEFVALLHGVSPAQALVACERLRVSIAAHDWGRIAPGLAVTASVGVHLLAAGDTLQQALDRADRALYAAKRGGRNRVVLGALE